MWSVAAQDDVGWLTAVCFDLYHQQIDPILPHIIRILEMPFLTSHTSHGLTISVYLSKRKAWGRRSPHCRLNALDNDSWLSEIHPRSWWVPHKQASSEELVETNLLLCIQKVKVIIVWLELVMGARTDDGEGWGVINETSMLNVQAMSTSGIKRDGLLLSRWIHVVSSFILRSLAFRKRGISDPDLSSEQLDTSVRGEVASAPRCSKAGFVINSHEARHMNSGT